MRAWPSLCFGVDRPGVNLDSQYPLSYLGCGTDKWGDICGSFLRLQLSSCECGSRNSLLERAWQNQSFEYWLLWKVLCRWKIKGVFQMWIHSSTNSPTIGNLRNSTLLTKYLGWLVWLHGTFQHQFLLYVSWKMTIGVHEIWESCTLFGTRLYQIM